MASQRSTPFSVLSISQIHGIAACQDWVVAASVLSRSVGTSSHWIRGNIDVVRMCSFHQRNRKGSLGIGIRRTRDALPNCASRIRHIPMILQSPLRTYSGCLLRSFVVCFIWRWWCSIRIQRRPCLQASRTRDAIQLQTVGRRSLQESDERSPCRLWPAMWCGMLGRSGNGHWSALTTSSCNQPSIPSMHEWICMRVIGGIPVPTHPFATSQPRTEPLVAHHLATQRRKHWKGQRASAPNSLPCTARLALNQLCRLRSTFTLCTRY
ncbi:uncharacterized protein EI97DRAFT_232341 [Westerdykella ornata]|uniref:Uncharacterized protein n=1 Tax=Westerdykella ornata TaxID=318751 RepID=A0A6A6J887_WESOR|nr:uncharacterized protein EI97DRAFT_232341 [Westerdykella ornata]KAF2272218.1 hypothetical protein EI97DRAFT_232341 [Westerdykella ornata]